MVMNTGQASMTATAASIISSNSTRKSLVITNTGSNTIYLGDNSSVTDSNGYPLEAGGTLKDTSYSGTWYGICSSGETSTANYIEEDN